MSKRAAARRFIEENIEDNEVLLAHLERFEELSHAFPELMVGDFTVGEVLDVVEPFLAASSATPEPRHSVVRALVSKLVDRARIDRVRGAIRKVLRKYELEEEDMVAVATVAAIVDVIPDPEDLNVFWAGLALDGLDLTLRTGVLLTRLARPGTPRVAESPGLPFDAVLHLALANQRFVAEHGQAFTEHGRSDAMVRAAEAAFAEAHARDFTRDVAEHYRIICESHVRAAQEEGDTEAAAEAIAWLQQASDEEFLKDLYASTLEGAFFFEDEDKPFIAKLALVDATDRWALEEYERFLVENGERERARRVRRFISRDR